MSRRPLIYTSGQQWVGILSEEVFLFSLVNMVASGSQFSYLPGMEGGVRIVLDPL